MCTPFKALRLAGALALLSLPAKAGELIVTKADLVPVRPDVWAATKLTLPEADPTAPLLGKDNTLAGARLLRILKGKGEINGFNGFLYDNRDRDHSSLNPEFYPSLQRIRYGVGLASHNLDIGLAGRLFFPTVVIGNSSMALRNGPTKRSLPRLAMTNQFWREITPFLYENNHIYIYPEHRDHDTADLFPINWPYMVISQGSSGSDRRFLNAIAVTLAALPRDTFEFLREQRLMAPTIQMLLRRNMANVASREDYLSGKAHPVVFDGELLQAERMMSQASKLQPADIPPLVRLKVVSEDFTQAAGLQGMDERLLDSPASISRLWRDFAWQRELVVTTEDTTAPMDQPLTFEWRLLRGDADKVHIEPQGPDGRSARIRLTWHPAWSALGAGKKSGKERRMSRVDIGVFANNGVHDSAPSLISIDFPSHQIRSYTAGPDGQMRLASIDYDAKGREAYFDPLLYWSEPWADTARYDAEGTLLGWDRVQTGQDTSAFIAHTPATNAQN